MNRVPNTVLALASLCASAFASAAPVYHIAYDYGPGTVPVVASPAGSMAGLLGVINITWVGDSEWGMPGRRLGSVIASGINDAGVVAGEIQNLSDGHVVTGYSSVTKHGVATTIIPASANPNWVPGGIARDGTIVGSQPLPRGNDASVMQCFSWKDGTMTVIGTPQGGNSCQASAINAKGVITGSANFSSAGGTQLFLYEGGAFRQVKVGQGGVTAIGINSHKHVVGMASFGVLDAPRHGFFYDGHTAVDIGVPDGMNFSEALSVNDSDVVVGVASDANNNSTAVVYQDGQLSRLDALVDNQATGWQLQSAIGVSNDGSIIVRAWDPVGLEAHALRLTPVAP